MSASTDVTVMTPAEAERETYHTKRVSEFVYGVISAMIAIAGITDDADTTAGLTAAAVVVAGAAAIWLAHSYADWLGEHVRAKGEHGFAGILHALKASWPIVIAGFILGLPVALAETGAWTVGVGLAIGNVMGLVMLFALGLTAARLARSTPVTTAATAVLTVGIGGVVIAIEQAVHHIG